MRIPTQGLTAVSFSAFDVRTFKLKRKVVHIIKHEICFE